MSFRGGGNRGGNNSFNIPLGIAYQDILSQSQLHNSEVPKLSLPVNNSIITQRETLVASYCMAHLNYVKDSVFNLGDVPKKGSNLVELDNSNEIERYGDKYLKHKKSLGGVESLEDHPFHKDLFPEELFNVMGVNKKKALHLKRFKRDGASNVNDSLNDSNVTIAGDGDENGGDSAGLTMLEKLKELAEEVGEVDDEEDEKANKEAQQKAAMEEIEEDEDFEEDEDDDDDYNAEKYFNDGDEDDDGYGGADDDDEPAF